MEKREVLISIVVPVRNRAGIVGRTLESISRQCYRPFELIIVDNASTDGTGEFLKSWSEANAGSGMEISVAECSEPGAPSARNTGLALARAPWVMFFDSDDTMSPTHLLAVARAIADNSTADIIGWDTTHIFLDGKKKTGRFYGSDMQHHNLFNGAMATQRWCARTEFVRRAGAWDNAVTYWNDIELGSRMLALDPDIAYIGAGGVNVYESVNSITAGGTADPTRMEAALARIEKTLGAKGHGWCGIKRAIEYARIARLGAVDRRSIMRAWHPTLRQRLVFEYTFLGGRGAARLAAR